MTSEPTNIVSALVGIAGVALVTLGPKLIAVAAAWLDAHVHPATTPTPPTPPPTPPQNPPLSP